jgi:AcrR family transcriptional regulator
MSSGVPPGVRRLRDQHAAATRRTILQAARKLFADRGYGATPIRLLAQQAGVAVQTIYDTFGSKAGVLGGLPDLLDEEAGVFELVAEIDRAAAPTELLALYARLRRQIRERCGDIIHVLRSGAAADTELAAALAEGMRRRRFGLQRIMERIASNEALKEGLSAQRATDIASAIVSDEVCDVLVEQGKWSFDDYESWVRSTLATLLLARSSTPDERTRLPGPTK